MKQILAIPRWILTKRSRIILTLLFLGAVGFFLYTRTKNTEVRQLETAQVEKGNIVATVSASGSILTANTLPITTSATGVVKKVYVQDGDDVVKGQKLAEIELDQSGMQSNAQAYASYVSATNQVAAAKNNLRSSEATLAKTYDDIQGHDTTETFAMAETRTKAEVAKDNAYLSLTNAQTSLSSALLSFHANSPIIYAPNTGTIDNITLVPGLTLSSSSSVSTDTTASRGERIAVIKMTGTPLATFNVSEIDVSRISQGQKATLTLDAIADKSFTGRVVSVDKIGSTTSGVTNYPVVIKFDTETPEILPNMAATANIILDTRSDVLVVPSSAITTSNGISTVKILVDGQEQTTPVELGLTGDSSVEIVSGLSEGDTIIVSSSTNTTTTNTNQSRSVFSPGGFGGSGAVFRTEVRR